MIKTHLLLLIALSALCGGALAQKQPSAAVSPSAKPQEIDEPVGKTKLKKAQAQKTEAPAPTKSASAEEGIIVKEGEAVEGFTVTDGKAVIRGRVKGDIHATNSKVTIEKKGSVEGSLILENSAVESHAESAVKVKSADAPSPAVTADIARIEYSKEAAVERENRPNWFAQQSSIWLLALLCGGIFAFTVPVATRKVTEEATAEPVRCLIIGGITALALSMVAVLNANLMHFSIRILSLAWSPFGFGVSVLLLASIAFGWVCGLNHLGGYVANRIGRSEEGTLLGRILLGASALFLASLVLGGVLSPLAVFTLLVQGLLAVLGMGAAIITGFGRDSNWLGSYLSRGHRFNSRS